VFEFFKYSLAAKDVKYSDVPEPVLKLVPNLSSNSPKDDISVGCKAGPLSVGPTNAAPISCTAAGKND